MLGMSWNQLHMEQYLCSVHGKRPPPTSVRKTADRDVLFGSCCGAMGRLGRSGVLPCEADSQDMQWPPTLIVARTLDNGDLRAKTQMVVLFMLG